MASPVCRRNSGDSATDRVAFRGGLAFPCQVEFTAVAVAVPRSGGPMPGVCPCPVSSLDHYGRNAATPPRPSSPRTCARAAVRRVRRWSSLDFVQMPGTGYFTPALRSWYGAFPPRRLRSRAIWV